MVDPDDAKDWAWRLAIDEAGIYPKAIVGGEHAYEKRTEWQEGHNAAIIEVTKRAIEIKQQYETEDQYEATQPQEPD